jgi:CubicO group peptidase (beta-lactamase class C family)
MHRWTLRTSVGALLLLITVSVRAAEEQDLSAILKPVLERHDVPAMAGAVVKGNKVVAIGAAGVRQVRGKERVTPQDKFHVGSCTKAMTATVCGMLVEEGKLKWSSTVAEVLPDLKAKMHADCRGITLEQLLQHRSGLRVNADDALKGKLYAHKGSATQARRMVAQAVLSQPPDSPPGTTYVYSNVGYALAGHMAEKVAGKPWEDLMRERLFKPLGMASAGFGPPGRRGKAADQPRGHEKGEALDPGRPDADNPAGIAPAGLVHCSIGEWAKFAALHLRGARGEPMKLLKPDTFRKLHAPAENPEGGQDYAMGWIVAEPPGAGGAVLAHDGSNGAWYATVLIAPGRDGAILVVCNKGDDAAQTACHEVRQALAEKYLTE